MSHTVIGIFQESSRAREAKQHLLSNGFSDSRIDISSSPSGDASSSRGTYDQDNRGTYDEDSSDNVGNFFRNIFGNDEDESRRYSEAGRRGTIVTVHASSSEEAHNAARILDQYGAMDLNEELEKNRNRDTSDRSSGSHTDSIPVIEEEMQIGKREVETGGVRLKSRIIERPVEEKIRLRTEHVNIERNPVNRKATEEDMKSFKEGTVEVTETSEVPVVNKDSRVVEEINLEKGVDEREETIRDTVRSTRVDAEEYNDDDRNRSRGTETSGRTGDRSRPSDYNR